MTSTAQPQLEYKDLGLTVRELERLVVGGVQRVSISLERKVGVRTLESSK
jgi:hypothetical protein